LGAKVKVEKSAKVNLCQIFQIAVSHPSKLHVLCLICSLKPKKALAF